MVRLHKILAKFKVFLRSHEKDKDYFSATTPCNLIQHYTGISEDRPSLSGLNRDASQLSWISLPDHRRMVAHSIASGNAAAASVSSFDSASTQDQSRSGHHSLPSVPPSPAHQREAAPNVSVTNGVHNKQHVALPGGVLADAHDFVMNQPNFNLGIPTEKTQEERLAEEAKLAKEVLEKLSAKGMPGAMLHAQERDYAPKCNKDTRQSLRGRIVKWGRDDKEVRCLLWLSGPAAVGKSAVAQTVAEQLEAEGLLGGVFFFSRPNNRSDPNAVIPTLVYQLALRLPEYRRIITQWLIEDPLILSQGRHSQFKKLIINPFLTLESHPPLLIVLDGLDECSNRDAQYEFVKMISHSARLQDKLRLRWLICSRPEPDLKVVFSTRKCKGICVQEKLEVDESEAQKDARRIFKKGLAEIRQRYPDQLTKDWPAKDTVHFIADRASGHLGFVSFLIRFIGDKHYDNPSGQLDACLRFLKHDHDPEDLNPLHSLDLLYTQILSDIPTSTLPITQRILGLFIFHGSPQLTITTHANFLGLDQASFYSALQRLHSVITVPPASEANEEPIQMYHTSFSDYLKDPARSGMFALHENEVHLDTASRGLDWLQYALRNSGRPLPNLTWMLPETDSEDIVQDLFETSFTLCWKACPQVSKGDLPQLLNMLSHVDFDLDYEWWCGTKTSDFADFVHWLASLGPEHKTPFTLVGMGKDMAEFDLPPEIHRIRHQTNDPHDFARPFARAELAIHYLVSDYSSLFFLLNKTLFQLSLDEGHSPRFSYY
ncbi:hypothetical protein D9756_009380 [Leucocoprinus leucothites]|uniref:Nephrocystin 3-like N-terminal domain-containing protein n=1 Tax=Leucocoprinus leucothites TaxID=201217 RepID=A0A8H5CWG1_9AGAR|nr:hypothetical protein D9756_009380 [Leucoagaricus leucothites]